MTVARVLLIVEGATDHHVATMLFERALVESNEWIEPEFLDALREYVSPDGQVSYLAWRRVREFAQASDPKVRPRAVHGGFGAGKGPDRVAARWARIATRVSGATVGIWLRDADKQPERSDALRVESEGASCVVAWGCAVPMIEAWLIGCFAPRTEEETSRLRQLRSELGFDPVAVPHRLSPTGGSRPAKAVAAQLGLDERERREDVLAGGGEPKGGLVEP